MLSASDIQSNVALRSSPDGKVTFSKTFLVASVSL